MRCLNKRLQEPTAEAQPLIPSMRHPVLVLAVTLAYGAASSAAQDTTTYHEEVRCVGGRLGLALPSDLRALKKLGTLKREEIDEVEQWDGYTTTRKTYYFFGLTLGVVEFSNDPAAFGVTFAEISHPSWNDLTPFKLQRQVSESAQWIGKPAQADPGLQRIYASEGDSLRIKSKSGVVTGVSYQCYSG